MSSVKAQLKAAKEKFLKRVEGKVRKIHSVMMEDLIELTRVDTGILRANWQPSLNSPVDDWSSFGIDISTLGPYPRGEMLAFDFAWLQATLLDDFKLGDTIYNTNNTPYRANLEFDGLITPPSSARAIMLMSGTAEANK